MHNYEFFVAENVNRNAVFLQAHLKVIETKVKHSVRSVVAESCETDTWPLELAARPEGD